MHDRLLRHIWSCGGFLVSPDTYSDASREQASGELLRHVDLLAGLPRAPGPGPVIPHAQFHGYLAVQ
jgi:hypothetical protein